MEGRGRLWVQNRKYSLRVDVVRLADIRKKCWVLFDSQIDNRQRELFRIEFDTADVPRDQFLVAGDAWSLCRGGRTDPSAFGILDMHGLWFIAGNIVRDIAALNNREMLPWDAWGAMRRQDSELDLAFFDRLAVVSREPDAHVDELSALYVDERVNVPGTVFNAELNCLQELLIIVGGRYRA